MNEAVDGEYQNYKAKGGGYTREHFSVVTPKRWIWFRTSPMTTSCD